MKIPGLAAFAAFLIMLVPSACSCDVAYTGTALRRPAEATAEVRLLLAANFRHLVRHAVCRTVRGATFFAPAFAPAIEVRCVNMMLVQAVVAHRCVERCESLSNVLPKGADADQIEELLALQFLVEHRL